MAVTVPEGPVMEGVRSLEVRWICLARPDMAWLDGSTDPGLRWSRRRRDGRTQQGNNDGLRRTHPVFSATGSWPEPKQLSRAGLPRRALR